MRASQATQRTLWHSSSTCWSDSWLVRVTSLVYLFGPSFNALGISVSLKHFIDGWVEFFQHRESSDQSLWDDEKVGELRYKDAIRLREAGFGSQMGNTEHACSHKGCRISIRCHSLLALFSRTLEVGKPRIISLASSSNWSVFTDACFEPEHESWKCGLGGI